MKKKNTGRKFQLNVLKVSNLSKTGMKNIIGQASGTPCKTEGVSGSCYSCNSGDQLSCGTLGCN